MYVPVMRGMIERRILVNYRVDPAVLGRLLPAPFRPKLVAGHGMAGVCLIRLAHVRPRWLPGAWGIRSENAAHRIAVEWTENGARREGVFIPRRDTSSRLNRLAGGRLFPGEHHAARFDVAEADDRYRVAVESADGGLRLLVEGRVAAALPDGSAFASLAEASAFFAGGSLGYSATSQPGSYDGLELRSFAWRVEPLAIHRLESSYFADRDRFPAGSVAFDSALLMRGIDHEWHAHPRMCAYAHGDGARSRQSRA